MGLLPDLASYDRAQLDAFLNRPVGPSREGLVRLIKSDPRHAALVRDPAVVAFLNNFLQPAEIALINRVRARSPLWMPLPGPQTLAYITKADELYYGGAAGGGKLLPVNTPIATPAGWTTMGALQKGDTIFSETGLPCRVVQAFAIVTPHAAYRLTFDDGTQIDAGAEHRWLTFTAAELSALTRRAPSWRAARRQKRVTRATGRRSAQFSQAITERNRIHPPAPVDAPTGAIRTTDELYRTLKTRRGRSNHAIPVATALQLPDAELPLDPYVLGAWLGDGSKSGGGFTGIDPEIWQEIERAGFTVTHARLRQAHYIRGLTPALRQLNILNAKHVPDIYLRASTTQRLSLLQGLMDTDGMVCDSGAVEFTNTNRLLAAAVYQLIVSLGWKCRMVEGRARLNGQDCGPKYDIKWTPDAHVFRLPRKRDRQKLATRRTTKFRYLIGCEPVEPVEMRCIAVDAPSHLYLAGLALVPTHNSDLLIGLATTAHKTSIIFRREFPQLKNIIRRAKGVIGPTVQFNMRSGWEGIKGGRILELGAVQYEDDVEKYKGRPHDLIAFDELPDFSELQYLFLTGWLRTAIPGQRTRIVGAGNPPTKPEGLWVIQRWAPWLDQQHPEYGHVKPGELRWFARVQDLDVPREDGKPFRFKREMIYPKSRTFIPALLSDNPFYANDPQYTATLQALPEPYRSQLLKGDFTAGIEDSKWQVIPTKWAQAAQARWKKEGWHPDTHGRTLDSVGLDVARGGAAKTVLAPRYGIYFAPLIKIPGAETPDGLTAATRVLMALSDDLHASSPPAFINVDIIGVGSSAYDHLVGAGAFVQPVDFREGSRAVDKSGQLQMRNLRAEAYWALREALDPASGLEIMLPPDAELLADLCAPLWRPVTLGGMVAVQIEEKEEVEKRIKRSPDCGDAVVMAFYNSGLGQSFASQAPVIAGPRAIQVRRHTASLPRRIGGRF